MSIILHNVAPVFAVIALGALLARLRFTTPEFYAVADRLTYFIFLPALLFWKTGAPPPTLEVDWAWVLAILGALAAAHLGCLAWVKLFKVPDFAVGSLAQGCYRFNTYIGLAVVFSAFGDAGVGQFGVLVGFAVPLINAMAVSTLIWHSSRSFSGAEKIGLVVKSIITNPLVVACAAGIAFSRSGLTFPAFVDNTLRLLSLVALPLALLSIGAGLSFEKLGGRLKLALTACLFKLVLLPVTGYLLLGWVGSTGLAFGVAMVFFALPTSTASYILSSQLGSDPDLASAAVVLTTLGSIGSLSVVMALFGG